MIMTLHCEAPDSNAPGRTASEQTVFFKLNADDTREAAQYRFLSNVGVPVPTLLLCVERPHQEVLGLEFLPTIGIEPDHASDLLDLVARLNAVRLGPEKPIGDLPTGTPQGEFEQQLASAIDRVSTLLPDVDVSDWLTTYRRVLPQYARLPQALTHGELAVQQIGRTTTGRLVIFDLATLGRRPRFADVANLLAPLSLLSCRSEHDLLVDYLDALAVHSGARIPVRDAWPELRLTRYVQEIEALPWQLSLDDGDDLRRHVMIISEELAHVR